MDEIVNSLNSFYEKVYKLTTENEVETNENLNLLITTFRQKTNSISTTARAQQSTIISLFNELYELTLSIDKEFNKLTKNIVEQ